MRVKIEKLNKNFIKAIRKKLNKNPRLNEYKQISLQNITKTEKTSSVKDVSLFSTFGNLVLIIFNFSINNHTKLLNLTCQKQN